MGALIALTMREGTTVGPGIISKESSFITHTYKA
jgi:hypothetical protein